MKIMVSAGEVSGDVHGSYLVKELKKINPDIHFFGMGSERLAAEGVDIKFDISKRGTIGIFEALPNVIPIYLTFLKMKRLALKEKPDLVLLVDSQGFNIPFARFCKKAGIKTVYYIAPSHGFGGRQGASNKSPKPSTLSSPFFSKNTRRTRKPAPMSFIMGIRWLTS